MRLWKTLPILAALVLVSSAPTGVVAAPTQVVMAPAPTTADGFTAMFEAKNDPAWSGGDQNTSIAANGRVYWITGDVMTSNGEDPDGSYPDGATMVSNRILLQDGDQLGNAMASGGNAVPDPATHTAANQERYWTGGGFYANNHLYVLCQRVVNDPNPDFPFKTIGVELAKFSIGSDGLLTLKAMLATPSTSVHGGVGPATIQWAGDAEVSGGYVYVHGVTLSSGNPWVPHFTYLARVQASKVENPAEWRFYAKSTGQWVSRLEQLNQDPTNQPDALLDTQTGSMRAINGQWVIAHKPWNGWGTAVYVEVGPSPTGPFTRVHVFDSPSGTWEGRNYITYGPQLHPEQTLASGRLLVSVNWNGATFQDVLLNADLSKPRFHEVTLP